MRLRLPPKPANPNPKRPDFAGCAPGTAGAPGAGAPGTGAGTGAGDEPNGLSDDNDQPDVAGAVDVAPVAGAVDVAPVPVAVAGATAPVTPPLLNLRNVLGITYTHINFL